MTRSPQRLIEMNHTRSSLRAAARVRKKEGVSVTVCLAADAMFYMRGGGHLWVYLNWALSLRALGCRVIWLETVDPANPIAETRDKIALFKNGWRVTASVTASRSRHAQRQRCRQS